MFIVIAIFGCLTLGVAAAVYLSLKRYGRTLAIFAGVVTLGLSGLFFPIPIHGGFTIVLQELIDNYRNDQRLREHEEARLKESDFLKALEKRFVASLPLEKLEQVSDNWVRVETGSDVNAWLDKKSGLIWTEPIRWNGPSRPSLEEAKSFCAGLTPRGYWALPTAAERVLFWQNGGEAISPTGSLGSIAPIIDSKLQMEFPQIDLGNRRGFAIRCVARSEGAPKGGYSKEDISLEIWNQYQIEALSGN